MADDVAPVGNTFLCVFCVKEHPDRPDMWCPATLLVNGTAKCVDHIKTRSWQPVRPVPMTTPPTVEVIDPDKPVELDKPKPEDEDKEPKPKE